jgi:hypothetical protein
MLAMHEVGKISMSETWQWFKNTFFWTHQFDTTWYVAADFLPLLKSGMADEKKYYWRAIGKRRRLRPEEAVYEAVRDIADSFYQECAEHPDAEKTLHKLAYALHYTVGWKEDMLPPRWRKFYNEYRAHRAREEAEREARSRESDTSTRVNQKAWW